MSKAISWLIAIITSIIIGVTYIPAPPKLFDSNSYYRGLSSDGEPDFRSTYNAYNSLGVTSIEECSRESIRLPQNLYAYEPTGEYAFKWFWALEEYKSEPKYLLPYDKDLNPIGYTKTGDIYTWKFDKQKYLLAFSNSNLVAASSNADSPYPELGQTEGVRMSLVVELPSKGKAFKVTYGSMERWWCCMKKGADGDNDDKEKPRFGHTIDFSDKDKFYSGSVLGLSGWSGIANREPEKFYLSIKIEIASIDSDGILDNIWKPAKLEDMFLK